tara:strand:+ start:110820 stop:111389 length:570 start_codon:yes stop_codon:yes gene_type:complete
MQTLPQNLQSHLDRELDEGESINWSAQPSYRILRKEAVKSWRILFILLILAAAVLVLFSILAYYGIAEEDSPLGLAIGAAVILIFAALLRWPMLHHAKYISNNTIYAITDTRAIIITLNKNKSITERDYRADELIHLARTEFPDGSGTLTLESARGAGTSNQVAVRHQLRALENVLEVERLLRTQFGNA